MAVHPGFSRVVLILKILFHYQNICPNLGMGSRVYTIHMDQVDSLEMVARGIFCYLETFARVSELHLVVQNQAELPLES